MKRALMGFAAVCVAASGAALAWDGNKLWEEPTTGPISGGAGIWGVGGKQDKGITCAHCHVGGQGRVGLGLAFVPALGANDAYVPGQRYAITATLTGQWLGRGFQTCGQYLMSMNGMGAAFEFPDGRVAGVIESDNAQSAASCPQTVADQLTGTTITWKRCHAVVGGNREDLTTWTFAWTAPAAGSGPVTLFWGVVDGNCDMTSKNDDVKVGRRALVEQ
ncbi:MAG: choice-of-anchor V domain-containing protein [Myxococcaceae bacterium]